MMTELMKTLELHYPMMQFIIIIINTPKNFFFGNEANGSGLQMSIE